MSSNWRPVLNKYLANFEVQTTTALENINELLTQSGQKFDDKIKGYFAKSVNSRLEQTLDFFDIQISSQADKNAKCTIKIESKCKVEESIEQVDSDVSSEGVEIIEKEIKFETISSDDDEKVENVSSSYSPISEVEIETTLQMTYERNVYRSSLDSSVSDRRSMCSPSTSNIPMMAPTLSPIDTPDSTPSSTPDINAVDIKQEPQAVPCKAMIFEKAQKDLGGIEVEKVRSNSTTVMKTNRSKLPSTSRSSSGPQVEHSMPVEPQLLKRQPTMSVENELTKRQKTTEVLQMNEPCPSIVFACFYCHNQPCFYVKKFAEVYSHWKNSHAELPLRFVAVRMATCFYCDQVDVFSNLQGHHKHNHNTEVFVVVDRENKSKCGLCHKILSASEMVVHFKTQHRPSHYMHISSPVCFTQSEIDQLLSINSSKLIDAPGQIEAFICGHVKLPKT
ncbi:uncharacterized protein LOC129569863 [Sitodiplosis mosellana]|uniref:uncharacterized protein LOC129569863 n=1 Tax=Sitodiplosis mosellana TaxID=263140 RepID=UPI002444872C|nr:uncharacterized protein LOC129569863 [Sitodiplosis mosellana]XP_055305030.1 uncharacterized protein LOC129569863 [Sitodiplosis mosellana]XP_055305031.1 uncharacterized protein LOC129569863 [Sitodiplosis mosellana]